MTPPADDRDAASALEHPLRRALHDTLSDGEERSLRELGRAGLPRDPALAAVGYHLAVMQRAGVVDCFSGLYRLA